MSQQSPIDWFKLKAQFGNEQLLKVWLADVVNGSEQEAQQIRQAIEEGKVNSGLLQQLQGIAALVCSPALSTWVKQLKQSEQPQADLEQCLTCYLEVVVEITHYLKQH
ncbi:hypothetical protein F9L16_15010 [Agarivorans sp. B2Z047]|uniref:hypothetical protein n=1 Tax=Agarivorans sp. B2Z047 TaxID=2652721 RepID=UPI00128E29D4|nr:hypothetical protein [Agarivorans sp. B2Z047]MPW30295.1 hypothetical protein [Agarivorans sp. B2Z047]UQN43074.1 hypothetical protein LQZ07_00955 [Agarivorans sp. B2Z047]